MRVIGLTGGIAAGKSTVTEALRAHGAMVIDADKVGHDAYRQGSETWQALVAQFGKEILAEDSEINRRALGAIVFADPAQREALQGIVWPRMKEMMRGQLADLAREGVAVVVLEAAVLIEARWDDIVDEVWVVQAPEEVALARLMARNGFSEDDARSRIRAQLSNAERAARARVVIENTGSIETTRAAVEAAWADFQQRLTAATARIP